jgi:hypothetical protein
MSVNEWYLLPHFCGHLQYPAIVTDYHFFLPSSPTPPHPPPPPQQWLCCRYVSVNGVVDFIDFKNVCFETDAL